MNMFEDMKKIKVNKVNKRAVEKWSKDENKYNDINKIDVNKYNVGLLTGFINNVLVLDIDAKDEGIEEFEKYILEFGEPMAIKQKNTKWGVSLFF